KRRRYGRHYRQVAPLRILEECHPFFSTIVMPMNHMRRPDKLDTLRIKSGIGCMDVGNSQVQQGFLVLYFLVLGQHEPRSTAVEERQVAERIEMRQPEHIAVPRLRSR